jgi:1-acyl-sn-glycerol-3-phosphate acyltransferase
MIRTLTAVALCTLAIIFVLPWFILWTLLSGKPDLMYRVSMNAIDFIMRLIGVRVAVEGLENIPPGTCIFVANHVSNVDPLAFAPHIPRRVSLMLKKELFRIPILSCGMRLAKFVAVDRASRQGAAQSLKQSLRYLHQGLSFAVYPEGTRSPDGCLRPFKKGAFVMAIEAKVPIVPVSIVGAQKVMRKDEWAIHPGGVIIRFGPLVDVSQYSVARRAELVARVHELVAAGLPPEQQPLSGALQPSQPEKSL